MSNRLTVLAAEIRAAHEAVRQSGKTLAQRVVEAGERLLEAKGRDDTRNSPADAASSATARSFLNRSIVEPVLNGSTRSSVDRFRRTSDPLSKKASSKQPRAEPSPATHSWTSA